MEIPIGLLLLSLLLLILLSAFFSGSEIGMMSLNRYRLRHLARQDHHAAKRAQRLLQRPDRLLGVILIGNTFANILASALTTKLASHWFGDIGVLAATILLTLVILIFAEIMPKTVAALHAERFAFIVSLPLKLLLKLLYPVVWLANTIANSLLKNIGVNVKTKKSDALSPDELRTLVHESSGRISSRHQDMLLRILDLEKVMVNDVMATRSEIVGIDVSQSLSNIINEIIHTKYTRLPVYNRNVDDIKGMLHVREAVKFIATNKFNKQNLLRLAKPAYFIPESTPLPMQLLNFEKEKQRSALVVDEYGDIQGLITIEDILAEIVGEFNSDTSTIEMEIHPQADGSVLVTGEASLREINRLMQWQLPTDGPKTVNGLIVEELEAIPVVGIWVRIADHPIEVLTVKDNTVKLARILPMQTEQE